MSSKRLRSSAPRETPRGNNSMTNHSDAVFEYQYYADLPAAHTGRHLDGTPITVPVLGSPPQMDSDETVRFTRISLPGKGDLIIRFWASGEPSPVSPFFGYFFDLLDLRLRPVRPPEGFYVFQSEASVWISVRTFERALQGIFRNDPSAGPEKYFVPEGARLQIVYIDQPIAELFAPVHPRQLNALGTSVQAPIVQLHSVDQLDQLTQN